MSALFQFSVLLSWCHLRLMKAFRCFFHLAVGNYWHSLTSSPLSLLLCEHRPIFSSFPSLRVGTLSNSHRDRCPKIVFHSFLFFISRGFICAVSHIAFSNKKTLIKWSSCEPSQMASHTCQRRSFLHSKHYRPFFKIYSLRHSQRRTF